MQRWRVHDNKHKTSVRQCVLSLNCPNNILLKYISELCKDKMDDEKSSVCQWVVLLDVWDVPRWSVHGKSTWKTQEIQKIQGWVDMLLDLWCKMPHYIWTIPSRRVAYQETEILDDLYRRKEGDSNSFTPLSLAWFGYDPPWMFPQKVPC